MRCGPAKTWFRRQAVTFVAAFAILSFVRPAGATFAQFQDPRGFTIEVPQGWRVDAGSLDQIAVSDPSFRAFALVRGRVARGDLTEWLARQYLATEGWVGGFDVLGVERVGRDSVRAGFRIVDRNGQRKRANALAVRQGDIATVFVAGAPEQEFAQALPLLAAVLDSFRFGGGRGAAPGAQLAFTTWADPVENAFTTQVPQGWQASGGIWRRGMFTKKPAVTLTSPDGRATVFLGNSAIPSFMLPSELLASLGWGEGSNGGTPGGVVSRYREASEFGAELIQQYFGPASFTARRERPDVAEPLRKRQMLGQQFATAADLEFQLADGRVGTLTIATAGYDVPGTAGAWEVEDFYGFVAPPELASAAGTALARLIGGFRVNPVWFAAELKTSVEHGRQIAAQREHSAALQQQTLEHSWAAQDRQSRQRRDVLGNTVQLLDPHTGERFETQAGSRYYYRPTNPMHDRTMVGVDVDSNPDPIEMRRMLQFGVDLPYR